jgi:cell division protein FtsL
MKKKKIILFSIIAAALMLSMPAISSIQLQPVEKNENKIEDSEKKLDDKVDCLLCGQSGETIYDLAEKIGITSKDIENIEEKVLKPYKETIETFGEEPEPSCIILLLAIIINTI